MCRSSRRVLGEEGDEEKIRALPIELGDIYRAMLSWKTDALATIVRDATRHLYELVAGFAADPIQQTRDFAALLERDVDAAAEALRAGSSSDQTVAVELTLSVDPALEGQLKAEVK